MGRFRPAGRFLRALFAAAAGVLPAALEAAPLHWVPVGPPGNPSITAMATAVPNHVVTFRLPSVLFAAAVGAGVFRSDDAGLTWTPTGPGLEGHDAVALAVSQVFVPGGVDFIQYSNTIFAAMAGAGVFRLLPDATAWVPANHGLTSLDVRSLLVDAAGVVYAGTAGGLFTSEDVGGTWLPKGTGLPTGADGVVSALAAGPFAASTLYAGTGGGLFKSTDGGENWLQLNTGSSFKFAASTIAVDPLVRSRIYAAGVASPPCYPLCLAPSFMTALRSLDAGATWSTMTGLDGNLVRTFAATFTLPSRVFAGTTGNGVFESSDGGATWAASNDGLGNPLVSSLVIDPVLPSLIFAGTSQGVFCAPLGQVAVTCALSAQTLCLNAQRFGASVVWRTAGGATGNGQALTITDNTGAFWFFDPTNLELVVKVLDARSVNGKFWVFWGSLTDVEFTLTMTDTLTDSVKTYFNPQGQLASVADTSAF